MLSGTRGSSSSGGLGKHAAAITALLLAAAMALPASAMAHGRHRRHRRWNDNAATQVDPPVTACEKITAPGYYTVSNDLVGALPSGSCLEIAVSDVTLNLQNKNLTGNYTGTGILVDAGVNNTYIVGASNFEVVPGVISGYDDGIVDGGDNTFIEDVNVNGNLIYGIFSAGAVGSSYLDFNANANYVGVEINNAGSTTNNPTGTGLLFSDFQADNNSGDGIEISDQFNDPSMHPIVKSVFITLADISSNGADGLLVDPGRNIALTAFSASGNGLSGVVFEGPTSTENIAQGGQAVNNRGAGIFVAVSSTHNRVSANIAQGNGSPDLNDGNDNCDDNHWFGNTFSTSNQSCIQ